MFAAVPFTWSSNNAPIASVWKNFAASSPENAARTWDVYGSCLSQSFSGTGKPSFGLLAVCSGSSRSAARRNAAFAIACMKGDKSGDPPWPGWRLRYFWARAMLQVGTPDGQEPSVSSAEWSVPAGFWSHVAGSWDGAKLRLFVNAVERAATDFYGQIAPQHAWRPLVLGNYIGRKDAYAFDGLLDDIKVFDAALTEDGM